MNKHSHILNDAKEREIKIKNTKKSIVAYTRLFEENHFIEHILA